MLNFELRRLDECSLVSILEVYCLCEDFLKLGPAGTASEEMILSDLSHSAWEGGYYCGIFDQDGKLLGVVDWIPTGFEGRPDQAFLSLLMIAQPYRGQGLGKAVVRRVESEIRANQRISAILCSVQVNNPLALRFWECLGYHIVRGPAQQPDGTITYLLQKELATG